MIDDWSRWQDFKWNVKQQWQNLTWWRVQRTWEMVRLYWGTEDCDYSTILLVMQHQIKRTREHMDEHAHVVGYKRGVRQMRIAEHLLERIRADDYYEIADARFPKGNTYWANFMRELEQQDMDMLALILKKHLKTWWD